MLQDGRAYAKLPASDVARARHFYVEVLGFRPSWEGGGHMRFDCADGSSFLVFPSSGRASGNHDQCGWVVDDIETESPTFVGAGSRSQSFPMAPTLTGSRRMRADDRRGSGTPREAF